MPVPWRRAHDWRLPAKTPACLRCTRLSAAGGVCMTHSLARNTGTTWPTQELVRINMLRSAKAAPTIYTCDMRTERRTSSVQGCSRQTWHFHGFGRSRSWCWRACRKFGRRVANNGSPRTKKKAVAWCSSGCDTRERDMRCVFFISLAQAFMVSCAVFRTRCTSCTGWTWSRGLHRTHLRRLDL